jgi:mRNA-degrading endonuclease RelE of RelBE toxin-antitoxin system
LPNAVRQELEQKKEILKKHPGKLATPLRGKLQGKYKVYLGGKRYRLICTIELNTKKIFLLYVKPRTLAYSKK